MLTIAPHIPDQAPYVKARALHDMTYRKTHMTVPTHQVISMMNLNPEDYVEPQRAFDLCRQANTELANLVLTHADQFLGAVAMLPMNDPQGVTQIMTDQVAPSSKLFGVQVFTRALGKSIADPAFDYIFKLAEQLNLPVWLHPVFDPRKPDNNIVFSWEYELTLAMQQLVEQGLFKRYPHLKIIVHHAGAMVPFFSDRIDAILPTDQAADFRKFYVDTAILGNPTALKLTTEFFGTDHVLFGTDAPLGIAPVGPTEQILQAIETMTDQSEVQRQILSGNARNLLLL